ncbi:DUF2827 family protein [Paraburkholderia sediminicola]|uniref:DUF2827 family protein n=1 Tax=Paraburkholderia sediminicola TaxID=458836 RepID=UPI0038B7D2E8
MKKFNVGITFYASKTRLGSVWTNGAVQNVYFLHQTLMRCPNVNTLWWINLGEDDELPQGLLMVDPTIKLVRYEQLSLVLDIVIELSAQLDEGLAHELSDKGTKLVSMRVGNDYIIDIERQIFDREGGLPFNGICYDAVWTLPQHERTCRDYFGVTLRCPVDIVPSVWSPYFFDKAAQDPSIVKKLRSDTRRTKKRIAIFEPNINVVKTAHYPMLVCEQAYRMRPDLIEHVYVTCAEQIMKNQLFVRFANALDIVKNGICTFEKRYATPWFLAEYTDIVVSHQWENELNYLYYDVLYAGYPLVHNSSMIRGAGYYYQSFNAHDGARALLDAIEESDSRCGNYERNRKELLQSVQATEPRNVVIFSEAIDRVAAGR